MLRSKGLYFWLRIVLYLVYLVNGFIAIPRNSVTYDEMDHWSYGKRILKLQPEKIYPFDDASAMPITGLNALPRATEQLLHPGLAKTDGGFSDIMNGRYVTLLVCLLIGVFIYSWAKNLWGEKAGLVSLFLFVFCPNLNAHAALLTTDAYTALFAISTFYFFFRFLKHAGWKEFVLFSISFGIAQITKQSLLHLFLILVLVSLAILVLRRTIITNFKKNLLRAVVFSGIVLAVINAAFFAKGFGVSISDMEPASGLFQTLSRSFVKNIPLPLPEPFVKGMDLTMHMNELGAGDPNVSPKNYLLGEQRAGKGFWDYYLVVFFYKTPLSVLISMGILLGWILSRRKQVHHQETILFLLMTSLYFLLLFGIFSNSQVGIRHVILVYPLLYVMTGSLVGLNIFRKWLLPVFLLYGTFSYYKFYPNLISYHNELVSSKNAYRIMADSNIDYGQSVFRVKRFLKQNPEYQFPGKEPRAGKFIVTVDDYLDTGDKHLFDWLSRNFRPSGHFDHCYLLFDISENDVQNIK